MQAAPIFMQMSQDSVNYNNNIQMTKENIPFDSVKKKLLTLLITGKEKTADEKEEVLLVS